MPSLPHSAPSASADSASFSQELETWASDLPGWQRHALWRLATSTELSAEDAKALADCLLAEEGLLGEAGDNSPTFFTAAHLKPNAATNQRLVGVTEIGGVNRLAAEGLTFAPDGLTIVFGDNGSGKTGYIRILRKACRTRIEKSDHLEILANVYGVESGPAKARLRITDGASSTHVDWIDGAAPDPRLSSLSVFDTRAAQLYVDSGNKLRFLPGGLDLPYRLNEAIAAVQEIIQPQLDVAEAHVAAAPVAFDLTRATAAQAFVAGLGEGVTDEQINEACAFAEDEARELSKLSKALAAGPERIGELRGQAQAAATLAQSVEKLEKAYSQETKGALAKAWKGLAAARLAHENTKALIAGKDPLGVGSETWSALWEAAIAYAQEADPHHAFPHSGPHDAGASPICPLCQQATVAVAERLKRFHDYASSSAAAAFAAAQKTLRDVQAGITAAPAAASAAEKTLIASIRAVDEPLADATEARFAALGAIRSSWTSFKGDGESADGLPSGDLVVRLAALQAALVDAANAVSAAQDPAARAQMRAREGELSDRRKISAATDALKAFRNKLKRHAALKRCHASCRTTEITKQANKWVERFLTEKAVQRFEALLGAFRIKHLKVQLERTGTAKEPGYKNQLTGVGKVRISDVLSEGEQRALSLAAFITEAELERPEGTLIIDDPVSSLDRERSDEVAKQLAAQATKKQVVVFTHDLVFVEQLATAASKAALEPTVIRVFATQDKAGIVDPAALPWKGQDLKQRVAFLTKELARIAPLQDASKTTYEYEAKAFYGRLRDAYERFVEEKLFHNVVTRFRSSVNTRELRYVAVPNDIATRFHEAFSKASLHSHDNAQAASVTPPDADEVAADLKELRDLIAAVDAVHKDTEASRTSMK